MLLKDGWQVAVGFKKFHRFTVEPGFRTHKRATKLLRKLDIQ